MKNKSPYLKHSSRLADIITGIQVMGSYPRRTSRRIDKWKEKLGTPVSATEWAGIVKEHPEFFRIRKEIDDEGIEESYVSLNWRWSFDKNYAPKLNKILSKDELEKNKNKPKSERIKITKKPLETEQIEALINTAIKLHESAHLHQSQKRWWVPIVVPAVTALVGAILGFSAPMIALDLKKSESTEDTDKVLQRTRGDQVGPENAHIDRLACKREINHENRWKHSGY